MAEELYRFMPFLQNVTGRKEGVSGEQQHKSLKDRISEHLEKAGVERPSGVAPTKPPVPSAKPPVTPAKPTTSSEKEIYRVAPWLRNLTGSEKGVSREEQHQKIKAKAAKHLQEAGIERPAGAAPIEPVLSKKGLADLRGSKTPGSATPADTNAGEGTAMDSAGKGNGYPEGVVRPMDYTKDPGKVQPSTVPTGGGSGSGGGEGRTSSEGLVQYGQTLGGLNTFNKGFLGEGYDLTDIQSTYQSEALPATLAGVTQLEKPLVEGANPTQKPDISNPFQQDPQLQASFPEGTKPFASTDSYTPYSTGGNPEDSQDGASPKPDRVERIRQVAFNGADFSGDEPDDSTLVSPMYANKKRNEIRRTFLDYEGSSVKAAVAANAVAGFGKDSNGDARFNVGGELLNAKEGMGYKAKNAAMMGQDPTEFLDIPTATPTEDAPSTPDFSKTDVTSSAFTTAQPEAQEFFKKELNKIKAAK